MAQNHSSLSLKCIMRTGLDVYLPLMLQLQEKENVIKMWQDHYLLIVSAVIIDRNFPTILNVHVNILRCVLLRSDL